MFLPALVVLLVSGSNAAGVFTSESTEKQPASLESSLEAESLPRAPVQPVDDAGWTFSITPYMWMFGMEGDVRINNTTADFDADFSDILDNLNFALMARVEGWKGKCGFFVDPLYGQLEAEAHAGPIQADVETDLVIVDFGLLYRFFEQRADDGRSRAADVSIGGRYFRLKNEIDFALAADEEESFDGIDLTVGSRYVMDLTDRFGFLVGGDIGGFDLGGSSTDFTWNAQALGSFKFGEAGRLWAGYRVLDADNDKGGSSGVEVQFSGPILGYEFRF